MDAPKCRICGEKHWRAEPCKLKDAVQPSEGVIRGLQAKIRELEKRLAERSKEGPKGADGRRAYMREYMRKRRAK